MYIFHKYPYTVSIQRVMSYFPIEFISMCKSMVTPFNF